VVDLLIINIRGLVQVRTAPLNGPLRGAAMAEVPVLSNAYLCISCGRIVRFGIMPVPPEVDAHEIIDASGCFVFPSFIDSHTHLIFPATREDEFVMKIKGASYAQIAAGGGGILNSAARLGTVSEEELFQGARTRIDEVVRTGTGAVEIKSGYGLTTESELKMLRVARRLKEELPVKIKTTFLGAHAVPQGLDKSTYVDEVMNTMIPAVAKEGLADYIDVFCEEGFFNREETERIIRRGMEYGMKGRIHANQLSRSGGVQAGVSTGALSVDHLENIGEEEIELLRQSNVIATALPGAAFFLNLPMPPARELINASVPVAIASDYNPGSSPSGNMPFMISLACIRMRMTPEEAINAATINAAAAIEIEDEYGSVTVGKVANLFITKPIPSIAFLPYSFGSSVIDRVILRGKIIPK
jgi:imidazolonepropionase